MVTLTITTNEFGKLTTQEMKFKTHRNAFMAGHNDARYFWLEYTDKKFPADNLVGSHWHFEPSSGVAMDVMFESEELKNHQLYVLCEQETLSLMFDCSEPRKHANNVLCFVEDISWPGLPMLEVAYYYKRNHHELRYNPELGALGPVDYRIFQALRRAELCYSGKHQKLATVYLTDCHEDFLEHKCGLNVPGWSSLTQEERFRLGFLTSFFNQALDILISDYDEHSFRQVVPDMKKVLSLDAVVFSNTKPLEKLPEILRAKKRVLNLATVLNADRKCGTSVVAKMDVDDDELRAAEKVCSLCSKDHVPPFGYPHGFWVGLEVFKDFGFGHWADFALSPIWKPVK